jgi:hypothetical protein
MSFLNFWLFCWVLVCVTIAALPSALSAAPGPIGERTRRTFSTHEESWLQTWAVLALPAILLEAGRHLPGIVINALPGFAVMVLAGSVAKAIHHNQRERQRSGGVNPIYAPVRRVLAYTLLFDGALAIVWAGGLWL